MAQQLGAVQPRGAAARLPHQAHGPCCPARHLRPVPQDHQQVAVPADRDLCQGAGLQGVHAAPRDAAGAGGARQDSLPSQEEAGAEPAGGGEEGDRARDPGGPQDVRQHVQLAAGDADADLHGGGRRVLPRLGKEVKAAAGQGGQGGRRQGVGWQGAQGAGGQSGQGGWRQGVAWQGRRRQGGQGAQQGGQGAGGQGVGLQGRRQGAQGAGGQSGQGGRRQGGCRQGRRQGRWRQ
mmetsp:Transcript_41068/g.106273  ORF Transcript_41068/g.106273 Transcript_41068/m.106273 type:complete len:235 (+) Transcript_41068:423-1127(+)